MGTRTADDPDGSDNDAVEKGVTSHIARRAPMRVKRCGGGSIGDDFVAGVTMNPWSGGFDVSELRRVSRTDGFHALGGHKVEDLDPILGDTNLNYDSFDGSPQVLPLAYT